MTGVRTGLDRIADGDAEAVRLVAGRNVGLLAHGASVDRSLRPASSVLRQAGAHVRALFGPEHGFASAAQDMVGVGSQPASETPVYSLYGDDAQDLSPKPEWLRGLDAIVIDLQDIGSRYYTYVWTAALMVKVAAAVGTDVVILDRPNPLGGVRVEGAPQREGYLSFVGLHPIAVRHGLTIAELMCWVCDREQIDRGVLDVVEMDGWRRALEWWDTDLPWVMPSPNMPTLDTALVYPGGCLVEGTKLSEGRGTTRPFELWGGPGLDVGPLLELDLHGVSLRPVEFTPTFQKHAGRTCSGVQLHVTDPWVFRPYEAYLRMLAAVLPSVPSEERWRTEAYEFVSDRPAIDLLTGGPEFRASVDAGVSVDEVLAQEARGAAKFEDERRAAWIYEK
ncbi:MAG: DUF1343 domain-containing protein [Deltaproteobacteria bacterium]|nr:DUF1343 domain-containing protein [Deltaproteobacteria bacterium]MBW2188094.1 DUF1343 domain-containing protein [Deltaproteobacteria bacterium]MBW2402328.1 DUF1343 domain-containing protein [Deltaproteobacteria bacterium]MBW2545719.1 DUF1343 domain-containing protein [Deltaproteobacteria bacterium]RLB51129.1 MAG: DUF1343 domain-containing protein [Deltaproteobacteria bacterium]